MTRTVLRPRLDLKDVPHEGGFSPKPVTVWPAQALGAVLALGAAVGVVASQSLSQRVAFACLIALGASLVGYFSVVGKATSPGCLGVASDVNGEQAALRFIPPRGVLGWELAMAGSGVAFGLNALITPALTGVAHDTPPGQVWGAVLAAASAAFLIQRIARLRTPIGLAVTPHGLVGVRGAGHISVPWEDLQRASVGPLLGGSGLMLEYAGGHSRIAGQYLGSDVAAVAAVIEHYRTHPDERGALEDGPDAIRALGSRTP